MSRPTVVQTRVLEIMSGARFPRHGMHLIEIAVSASITARQASWAVQRLREEHKVESTGTRGYWRVVGAKRATKAVPVCPHCGVAL